MDMDLRYHARHPCPEKLTPRQLMHFHALMMGSINEHIARGANAIERATSCAFNGDKQGTFRSWMNRMLKRPVFRIMKPVKKDVKQNVADREEAAAAALKRAEKVMAMMKTE